MQIADLTRMIREIEGANWGPGKQVSSAHFELFDDGSGKFIVQMQCTEGSRVEKLIGAICTTDYKFEFDSIEGIEAAYQLALNHQSSHPELG